MRGREESGSSLMQASRLALCVFVHEKILIRWIYLEGGLLEYRTEIVKWCQELLSVLYLLDGYTLLDRIIQIVARIYNNIK